MGALGHFGPLWATFGSVAKFNAAVMADSLWCKAGAVAASHNFEKDYNFEEWLQPIPIGTKKGILWNHCLLPQLHLRQESSKAKGKDEI